MLRVPRQSEGKSVGCNCSHLGQLCPEKVAYLLFLEAGLLSFPFLCPWHRFLGLHKFCFSIDCMFNIRARLRTDFRSDFCVFHFDISVHLAFVQFFFSKLYCWFYTLIHLPVKSFDAFESMSVLHSLLNSSHCSALGWKMKFSTSVVPPG